MGNWRLGRLGCCLKVGGCISILRTLWQRLRILLRGFCSFCFIILWVKGVYPTGLTKAKGLRSRTSWLKNFKIFVLFIKSNSSRIINPNYSFNDCMNKKSFLLLSIHTCDWTKTTYCIKQLINTKSPLLPSPLYNNTNLKIAILECPLVTVFHSFSWLSVSSTLPTPSSTEPTSGI